MQEPAVPKWRSIRDQRSYVCPFCDSTYVVELPPQQAGRQPPEFVIGFAVTRDQASEHFRQWLGRQSAGSGRGDLRPGRRSKGKLHGVYIPFWSFSMRPTAGWPAAIGEHWYRTETYTTTDSKGNTTMHTRQVQETEWYPLAGRHHHYYSAYLVSGSKGLPQ